MYITQRKKSTRGPHSYIGLNNKKVDLIEFESRFVSFQRLVILEVKLREVTK